MDIQVVFQVMLKLFIILVLGYVLNKTGIFDEHTNKRISALITKVTAPFLIISSALSASTDNRMQVIIMLMAGFAMYIGFIVVGRIVVALCHFPKADRRVYECMLVFSNNSFMGFPVLQSIFGTEAIFYSSMIHFSFNILIYTYAVYCLSEDKEEGTKFDLKRLLTPGLVLTILALVVYITGFRSTGVVYDTIYMVGNVTAPLSMLVLGSTLALYPLKESLTDVKCYAFSVIRLVAIPVITFAVCRLLNINDFYTGIVTVTNAMPVASMVLMIGNECNANSKLIIRNIVVTTMLSVVTIPVIAAVLL